MKKKILIPLLAAMLVTSMPVYAYSDDSSAEIISLADDDPEILGYVMSTASNILNIRSGPGLNYSIIGDFPHGEVAELLGESGGWYLIRYNGITGYCAAEYTVPAEAPEGTETDAEDEEEMNESEDEETAEEEDPGEDSTEDDDEEDADGEDADEEEQEDGDEEDDESLTTSDESDSSDIYPWRKVSASSGATKITYDGLAADEYDFEILITHSGEIGTAEYRLSSDGGQTWTDAAVIEEDIELTVTNPDGTVSDTGLAVHFTDGRYSIGDEYAFSTLHEWYVAENKMGEGVLYAAGVPAVSQTIPFTLRIVESGSAGTMTYQYSYDNGETWSKEIKSDSDGEADLGNGIVLMFYGSFMAGDTYQAEIIGQADQDYTIVFILVIAGILAVLFGAGYFILSRKRTGRDQFELIDG